MERSFYEYHQYYRLLFLQSLYFEVSGKLNVIKIVLKTTVIENSSF